MPYKHLKAMVNMQPGCSSKSDITTEHLPNAHPANSQQSLVAKANYLVLTPCLKQQLQDQNLASNELLCYMLAARGCVWATHPHYSHKTSIHQ